MSGLFRNQGSVIAQTAQNEIAPSRMVTSASGAAPAAPAAPEPTASAGLGAPLQQQPTSRITNRASTMLSNRRAGEDVPVGTKKLLGQ